MANQVTYKSILITKHVDCLERYLIQDLTKIGYSILTNEYSLKKGQEIPGNINHYNMGKNLDESYCAETDTIISTLGISLPQETDFNAILSFKMNFELLDKAKFLKAKKFICIFRPNSSLKNSISFQNIKEEFFCLLKKSGISYTIIHVDTLFSDYMPLLSSAYKYSFLFLKHSKQNFVPIHLKDLAKACIHRISETSSEIYIGGPEVLNKREISKLAYHAFKKQPILFSIPPLLTILKESVWKVLKKETLRSDTYRNSESIIYTAIGEIPLSSFFNNEVRKVNSVRIRSLTKLK